ncbi:carboxypeptidase M32 [Tranquillimonas alkanivorans]|uniref:Metal-dependent carboxypeptidase n=1 Tax=Tranquillimonas alkanivorans TaxID=441119 RepID=A0A1I5UTT6_9RHOB|nr:carboxypeptidase M32 [Tranquillimonas alkanivorans]SFP98620.1 carboxypeptidase Taq [Tranquillimonas alkanivorans]
MSDLHTRVARLNDVLCTVNALQWDARVMMPPGGAETRGHQIATLKGLAREMILDPGMEDAAQTVLHTAADDVTRRAAQAVLEARDHHARIPADLLRRQAEKSAVAGAAWAEARAKGDFALFRPHLEEIVGLARQEAEALGHDGHPYDPMAQVFEPGETAASLSTFFETLRAGLKPILDTALGKPKPRTDFLYRDYPVEAQQAFCRDTAESLGYDTTRGRLDTAVHPFEISFTRQDVRITSRWNPGYLPMSIFGTIHETGHALYEMGVDPAFTRTAHATDMIGLYAVGGTSFGMHESQSRLLENHVGRSPAFWARHFSRLRDTFPEQLGDVSEDEFVAAVNRVEPGLIRVEADELTYDLHIMLRVRIEMALMDGSLSVDDVPEAWNAAMREDLGLEVPHDGLGCLQDVHWSHGYIGSFPTYTIGNATAAQLMAHLDSARPDVRTALDHGETGPLRETLHDLVWRHGRSRSRADILRSVGQEPNDVGDYLTYLRGKFGG